MNVVEILKAAKAKIENPANWIKEDFAKDRLGYWCAGGGTSTRATCFCSLGAIEAVVGIEYCTTGWNGRDPAKAQEFLTEAAGMHLPNYNDRHTHEEVMAVWDKAIALAEAADDDEIV